MQKSTVNDLFALIRDNKHEELKAALEKDCSSINSYAVVVPLELGRWIEETPLHFAAYCGSQDCVRVLLAFGADATLPLKDEKEPGPGFTPGQLARKYGYDELAQMIDQVKRHRGKHITTAPKRVIHSGKAGRRFAPKITYAEARSQVPLYPQDITELEKALAEQTAQVERLTKENQRLVRVMSQQEEEIHLLTQELEELKMRVAPPSPPTTVEGQSSEVNV